MRRTRRPGGCTICLLSLTQGTSIRWTNLGVPAIGRSPASNSEGGGVRTELLMQTGSSEQTSPSKPFRFVPEHFRNHQHRGRVPYRLMPVRRLKRRLTLKVSLSAQGLSLDQPWNMPAPKCVGSIGNDWPRGSDDHQGGGRKTAHSERIFTGFTGDTRVC